MVQRMLRARALAWFHLRAPRAVSASPQSAARTPATLFATRQAPVPVQHMRMASSASPPATSRAAARLTTGQSSSAPGSVGPK